MFNVIVEGVTGLLFKTVHEVIFAQIQFSRKGFVGKVLVQMGVNVADKLGNLFVIGEICLICTKGGEVVKIIFLMELEGLNGREKLKKYDVGSVIKYEGK